MKKIRCSTGKNHSGRFPDDAPAQALRCRVRACLATDNGEENNWSRVTFAGTLLIGIDLASGDEVGIIPMSDKEPQFMVNAIGSRVYHFKDKAELLAYDF